MSNKKTNQKPKNQNQIISWFFNQPFGKDLISLACWCIPCPSYKNMKRTEKRITKYLESFDKISQDQNLKTALLVISDKEINKSENVNSSFGISSWNDFVNNVKTQINKNINSIPPFKYEIITKWIDQWNFANIFSEIEKDSFENLKVGVNVLTTLENLNLQLKMLKKEKL
jgi:hypothetical protein